MQPTGYMASLHTYNYNIFDNYMELTEPKEFSCPAIVVNLLCVRHLPVLTLHYKKKHKSWSRFQGRCVANLYDMK